jgi:hypothetical protein
LSHGIASLSQFFNWVYPASLDRMSHNLIVGQYI